jgi:hypothetical protein
LSELPRDIRELLLSDEEPGQIYRRCLDRMRRDGISADYALTEQVVYGCEVRYAVQVLEGRIPELYNFGDLDGHGTELLWTVLEQAPGRRVALLGSGPYPVTALLIRNRYPDSEVTCFDNNLSAFLLGGAVLRKLAPEVRLELQEAHHVDGRPFDVIVVAAMITGRKALVNRLLAETEAELIVRGTLDQSHPRLHTAASAFSSDGRLQFRS